MMFALGQTCQPVRQVPEAVLPCVEQEHCTAELISAPRSLTLFQHVP
uniref:Uncharacterized protein n=1 Tax=Anguilla anguilla TaxID=7936 RepID=A0A0E9RTX1_ANGAN